MTKSSNHLMGILIPVLGSEADSHGFVLEIPASNRSEVIYLTAPTTAEVSQKFRETSGI